MLKTRIAKIAGLTLGVTFALGLSVNTASAQTVAELQAQINALMAQLAALSGTSTNVNYTFTQNLTVGSTGGDVVSLQQYLVGGGYLNMPAGVSYGYFGALTKAAVAKWQAANGVSPAVGYWGPLSRAKANSMVSVGGTGTVPGTTIGGGGTVVGGGVATLQGGEGRLVDFNQLGDVDATVEEGQNNVKVLGVEFEADDADLSVQRVDVTMTLSGTGSTVLSRYIKNATLMMNGTELATMSASEASKDGSVYTFRFAGMNGIVRENASAQLYVVVDAVDSIDSTDTAKVLTVAFPALAIRALDAAGISDTYGTVFDEAFSVVAASAGDLSLTEATSNPDLRDVEVDADADTSDVTLLAFDLEADDQDVTVTDIRVELDTATSSVSAVFRSVTLYNGSTPIETKTISATTTAAGYVIFDDIDLTIADGSTKTLTVKALVNDTEAGASGTGFYDGTVASSSVTVAGITAEDEAGDSVTATGSTITGGDITFRVEGINATPGSTSAIVTSMNTASSSFGTYTINFTVSAFGDDAYIYNGAASTTVGATVGVVYDIEGTAWTGGTESAILTSSAETSGSYFRVPEGQPKTFSLTVTLDPAAAGTYALELEAIGFNDTAATADGTLTIDPNNQNFQTDSKYVPN